MNKIKLLSAGMLLLLIAVSSCRKEFDDHYEAKGKATIDKSIVEVLRERPEFSLFVQAIDRFDLSTTLGKSGIYTCLAPRNEDVETFLKSYNVTSVSEVPEAELRKWLNYHFVNGMTYYYDFDKKFIDANKENCSYPSWTIRQTREEEKYPGKFIRFYTNTYFAERATDYNYMYGKEGDGFMVNDVKISDTERDIDAANGVIHILEEPLDVLPRADEAMAMDPNLTILKKWFDATVIYSQKEPDEYGRIDTTKTKVYTSAANLANEATTYSILAPTDKAFEDFFGPYLSEFDNDFEKIPKDLQTIILDAIQSTGYNTGATNSSWLFWGMKDIVRNNPYFIAKIDNPIKPYAVYPLMSLNNRLEPNFAGCINASNALIYKTDKMILPPVLDAVEGGIYMHPKSYSYWSAMLDYLSLGTDIVTYQHSFKTVLVQPDKYWEKSLLEYSSNYRRDTLRYILSTGLINSKIDKFEHRYYPTSFGSILYEDGAFYDYLGNKAELISSEPTWEGANGSMFEVKGFLQPLTAILDTLNIYNYRLDQSKYTSFTLACEKTEGLVERLKQGGYFNYTVFAPTNESMEAAGLDVEDTSPENLEKLSTFVQRHIVTAKVFTDGAYSDGVVTFQNLLKETIRFTGSWGSFQVIDPAGNYISINSGEENQQANNGVLHGISTVFKAKQ